MNSIHSFHQVNASASEQPNIERATPTEIQRFISRPQFTVRYTLIAGFEFQPHSHSAFTVTTLLAGRMAMTIGERVYELSPGESALTNVNQAHSAYASEVEFISIQIAASLVNELVAEIGLARVATEI